jgi:RNA polymerase sigma-70 factor (ECF subfamily)
MKTGKGATGPGEGLVGVFVRCRSVLMRVVGQMVKPHDVEDIVQEAFVRAFEASRKGPIRHPRAFMFKTAHNLAISHLRRAEGRLAVQVPDFEFLDAYMATDALDSELESRERFLVLCEAIRVLPRQYRRPFIMKRVYGFSQKEISEQLGLSESTVEKRLSKGL